MIPFAFPPQLWVLDHRVLPQRLEIAFYLSETEDPGAPRVETLPFRTKLTDVFNKPAVSSERNLLTIFTCETLDTLLKLLRYKPWGLKILWGGGVLNDDSCDSVISCMTSANRFTTFCRVVKYLKTCLGSRETKNKSSPSGHNQEY